MTPLNEKTEKQPGTISITTATGKTIEYTPPPESWKGTAKAIGSLSLMFLPFLGLIALVIFLVKGFGWLATTLFPLSTFVAEIALFLVFPISLLLAIPRATRWVAGLGAVLISLVLGFNLWLCGLRMWWHPEWAVLMQFMLVLVAVYVVRLVGQFLISKSDS